MLYVCCCLPQTEGSACPECILNGQGRTAIYQCTFFFGCEPVSVHASASACVERLETNDPNIRVSSPAELFSHQNAAALNEIQLSGRLVIFINDRELFHLNTAFLKTGIIPTSLSAALHRPGWLCAPALSLCVEKSASSSPHHTDTSHIYTDFRTQRSHSVYSFESWSFLLTCILFSA